MLSKFKKTFSSMDPNDRNNLLFVCEGATGAIILNLINPFFSMFARRIGAGDFQIGLVTSLPALVGILALIPGALIVDRQRDKKKIVALLILLTGLTYPLAALTPYMGNLSVILYITIIALMNWPFSVFTISWQSFFSDVFSQARRNMAYTRRSKIATFLGALTTLAAGLILSYIPRTDGQRIITYQTFFIASFGLILIQRWFLLRVRGYNVPDNRVSYPMLKTLKNSFRMLAKDKNFSSFVIIAFLFHITWQMAWPLYFIYQVDFLHANEAWISYIAVGTGIAGVATYSFWGRVIEKKGARIVVVIGGLGLALNPVASIATKSLLVVLLMSVLTGLTFSGFQLSLFENLLEVVPEENKTLNIAIYTTFINVSGFAAPILGVALYKATSIYIAMIIASFLRLSATGLFYLRYRKLKKAAIGK